MVGVPLKGKDRLYLSLMHRHEKPGFHWSIMLAPVDPPKNREETFEEDTVCWDVIDDNGQHQWRLRERCVSQYACVSLVARVLLGKFDVRKRENTVAAVAKIAQAEEIRQNEPTFRCRLWTINCVQALVTGGLINLRVPTAQLPEVAEPFAGECAELVRSGKLDIAAEGTSSIPVLDLRKAKN